MATFKPVNLSVKQDTLISGTNIKSVNGTSLLGAGDLVIAGGGGVTDHTLLTNVGTNTHAVIDTSLTRLANTSGTNTGDQDLSTLVVKVTGKSLVADTEIAKIHAAGTDIQDLSGLQPKESGKGLSTNDYTTVEKTKLSGIADSANNYTHPSTHPASIVTAGTLPGAVKAAAHGTATNPEIVNVIYGTGTPPAANTTPIGTLYIKYTA